MLLAVATLAQPPLTTIQDVIYKADGTRFNGQLTISWSSFEAADQSAIATQMLTVKVMDGALRVKLVPNTTATPQSYYAVVYNSDGKVQFSETWAVPPSTQPLRVRDVRVATPTETTQTSAPTQESNVVGLVADLGARPVKATGFAAGRIAFVNSQNQIDSVTGNTTDCVHVDGSSGPCSSAPSFVDADAPTGVVDGANTSFSLTGTPDPAGSLAIYRNGLLQKLGVDYTLSGRTIQFGATAAPQPGDTLLAAYRLGGVSAGTPSLYPSPQVVCGGSGATVSSLNFSSLGTCVVPAGLVTAGDRVEIRFDLEHQGVTGYTFEALWGSTSVLNRDATAADLFVTARVDAILTDSNARFATQSWGSTLPLAATMATASDAYTSGLTIDFQGKVAQAGETLVLRNFTVVRLP